MKYETGFKKNIVRWSLIEKQQALLETAGSGAPVLRFFARGQV
jgi:hypothetical protein